MRRIITNHGALTEQEFETVAMLFLRAQTGMAEVPSSVQVDHLLRCYSVDRSQRDRARAVAERVRTKLQLAA
jgi:hypothetical protein